MNGIRPDVAFIWPAITFALLAAPGASQLAVSATAGPAISTIGGEDVGDSVESVSGFFAAVGAGLSLHPNVEFHPSLGYVQKGFSAAENEVKLGYVTVPALVNASVRVSGSTTLSLLAGPVVSFRIACEQTDATGTRDCPEDTDPPCTDGLSGTPCLRTTDSGAFAGLSVGFPLSETLRLDIGGGYEFGLQSIDQEVDWKNRTIYVFGRLSTGITF